MRTRLSPILVLEDDSTDMFLFTRLLKAAGIENALHLVRSAEEAIERLERWEDPAALSDRPVMAFIDVGLSPGGGIEVLRWIRGRSTFDRLPIVILSSEVSDPGFAQAVA